MEYAPYRAIQARQVKGVEMSFRQWVNKIGAVLVVAMFANAAYQYFFKRDKNPETISSETSPEPVAENEIRPEDSQGLQFIASPLLYGAMCEKLDNAVVFDRTYGTATANNHPAYVFGYRFTCVSNFGNETKEIYVGWVDNKNTDKLECLHHNASKQAVLIDGWHVCGGNFHARE